jgi:hypothetical protein
MIDKTLDVPFSCVIDSRPLEKVNLMKGGARPMFMDKFYTVPLSSISDGGFDSRSAPVHR